MGWHAQPPPARCGLDASACEEFAMRYVISFLVAVWLLIDAALLLSIVIALVLP
jgi:hypothetical protein